VVGKTILLINEEGERRWLGKNTDGSLWQGDGKIFASETEATQRGWRVDAVKIVFESSGGEEKR